ncbi:MAG: hypothetical protein IKU30_00330 [Clostridia bacterium]|nr:hypothetical protein [Clostridia bacterium]
MKRFIALTLLLTFVFSLAACEATPEEPQSVSNGGTSLEEDIGHTEESGADNSIDVSGATESDEIKNYMLSTVFNSNLLYLTENTNDFTRELWIEYADGLELLIHKGRFINYAELSPDKNKILFTEYEWETCGKLYVYNFETNEANEIELALPEDHVVYNATWLDNENIVFTDIFSQGTIASGGNVYIYGLGSTRGYCERAVVTPPDGRLMIESLQRSGDNFILSAHYFNEDFSVSERLYYILPYSELRKKRDFMLMPNDGIGSQDYRHYAEPPTLEERANLDYVVSVEGGRELDYDTLISMTPEQIEAEIFEPASRVYREFMGLGWDLSGYYGTLEFNWFDENGKKKRDFFNVFAPNEEVGCYNDFVALVRKYFSKEMSKQLFGNGLFFEYEGVFLFVFVTGATDSDYRSHEYSIKSYGKNEIIYNCRIRYVHDEYGNLKDEELKEEHCYYKEFTCKLILEDGKWVFDSFKLPVCYIPERG